MHIITLLTDWKNNDYYKAVVKASILSKTKDVQFVDISHKVNNFHIPQAAFILNSVIHQFPEGTIHFFGIQTVKTENSNIIIGKFNNQYIIANDNGVFDALNIDFEQLISLDTPTSSFPILDIFCPAAIKIIKGEKLNQIGSEISETLKFPMIKPAVTEKMSTSPITYIDSYGNLIVNIQKDFFESERKGRRFNIFINSLKYSTNRIHKHYNEVPKSEIFSIFNSVGWLELGMRMANISQILNVNEKSNIIIKFYEE